MPDAAQRFVGPCRSGGHRTTGATPTFSPAARNVAAAARASSRGARGPAPWSRTASPSHAGLGTPDLPSG